MHGGYGYLAESGHGAGVAGRGGHHTLYSIPEVRKYNGIRLRDGWDCRKEEMRAGDTIKQQIGVLTKAEGFCEPAVLFALLKLEIFERIGAGIVSADTLAARSRLIPSGLNACCAPPWP